MSLLISFGGDISTIESYNRGVELFNRNNDSADVYFSYAHKSKDSIFASKALYNSACVAMSRGNFALSLRLLKRALLLNPNDENIRYNYQFSFLKSQSNQQKQSKTDSLMNKEKPSEAQHLKTEADKRILETLKKEAQNVKNRIRFEPDTRSKTSGQNIKNW